MKSESTHCAKCITSISISIITEDDIILFLSLINTCQSILNVVVCQCGANFRSFIPLAGLIVIVLHQYYVFFHVKSNNKCQINVVK